MDRHLSRNLGVALLVVLLSINSARATSIDSYLWEQLARDSSFFGIAECEVAGGIVAHYRVVESWKGPAAGSRITIRITTVSTGDQFPIALVGDQYLVAAFKSRAPSNIVSTTMGAASPFGWRSIPAEYAIPLFQGRTLIPPTEAVKPFYLLGSDHPNLQSFKEAVSQFLALSAKDRELLMFHRLSDKYLTLWANPQPATGVDVAGLTSLKVTVLASTSTKAIVDALLDCARHQPARGTIPITQILRQAGEETALKILEAIPADQSPLRSGDHQDVIGAIRARVGLLNQTTSASAAGPVPRPSPASLDPAQARAALDKGESDRQFAKAFEYMTIHEPERAAAYLADWENPSKPRIDDAWGYVLGSYFAWRCGLDRKRNLGTLLTARDPYIRVAGAVYLCFENEAAGMAELRRLTGLPGDPGVWAAITLLRRGDKSVMARAIDVFAVPEPAGMTGQFNNHWRLELIVLLSNSAKASGLPQPLSSRDLMDDGIEGHRIEQARRIRETYTHWWSEHQNEVVLSDPWAELLNAQKID